MKKYDLHEIMSNAWSFVKSMGLKMSDALKRAWKMAKLVAVGGREWMKYGKHRIYFNDDVICKVVGLSYSCYKSGNISSASINGEAISHAEASRYLSVTAYFDVISGRFFFQGVKGEEVVNAIKAYAL